MHYKTLFLITLAFQSLFTAQTSASTAAFEGTVVDVKPATHKDSIVQFTCSIDHFDYISWNKFNKDSKVGEVITRQTKKLGTATMIDGRLVNVDTFSKAIKPGQWGYFYEDTWLDLRSTPNFQWGQVVSHDKAKKSYSLRIHRTHKEYHLKANPPQIVNLSYNQETILRQESLVSSSDDVLQPGNWVQVHPARTQIINVWSAESAFKPSELLPAEQGKRGSANSLTAPATLISLETETPNAVIDLSCKLEVQRQQNGSNQSSMIDCRKTSFILDGKLCPANIAVRQGRHAVLGHYRSEKTPHKIFVRSQDDAIRGVIKSVEGQSVVISHHGAEQTVVISSKGKLRLDGVSSTADQALKPGREITVYPDRGPTIISFGQ